MDKDFNIGIFEKIWDEITTPIVLFRSDFQIIYSNKSFNDFDVTLSNMNILNCSHPFFKNLEISFLEFLQNDLPNFNYNVNIDNEIIWYKCNKKKIVDLEESFYLIEWYDITELKEQLSYFSHVIEEAPLIIYGSDTKGNTIFANKKLKSFFLADIYNTKNEVFNNLTNPIIKNSGLTELINKNIINEKKELRVPFVKLDFKHTEFSKREDIIYSSYIAKPYFDHKNQIKGFTGYFRPFNELIQKEFHYKERDRFFSFFASNPNLFFLVQNSTFCIIDYFVLPKTKTFVPESEFIGFDLNLLPLGHDKINELKAKFELAIVSNEEQLFNYEIHVPETNQLIYYEARILKCDFDQVYVIIHDVSQKKFEENAFKENIKFIKGITDSSDDILFIYDLINQSNIYANNQIYKKLGYTLEELMESGAPNSLIYSDDLKHVSEKMEFMKNEAKDDVVYKLEYRSTHKNGQLLWWQNRIKVYERNENGLCTKIVGSARDISREKYRIHKLEPAFRTPYQQIKPISILILVIYKH